MMALVRVVGRSQGLGRELRPSTRYWDVSRLFTLWPRADSFLSLPQTLVLIPTPRSKPFPRYSKARAAKESDPLVIYNFIHPFRTSVPTELKVSKDADLALGQLSSLIVKAAGRETEAACGVHWTRFTPAYTALVIDPSGALYHVPLSRRELTLRQLMAAADIVNAQGGEPRTAESAVRVALTVFFPALLTSEVSAGQSASTC